MRVSPAPRDVRRLVLQKADGTYLVALWRDASVWDAERTPPAARAPRARDGALPRAARVTVSDPAPLRTTRRIGLRHGRARVELGARPLLLHVMPR